jgi:hypothetical protein
MTEPSRVSALTRALIVAGLFLSITAAVKLGSPDYIDADFARRLVGVMMGGIVVLYANSVPKTLTPLAVLRCSPAAEQSLRRFTGLSLVLGGLGFGLAWMVAPIDAANVLGGAALGIALLVVAIRFLAVFARRSED